jgi:hypothetical protein
VYVPHGTKLEVVAFLARREVLKGGFLFWLFIGFPEGIGHAFTSLGLLALNSISHTE